MTAVAGGFRALVPLHIASRISGTAAIVNCPFTTVGRSALMPFGTEKFITSFMPTSSCSIGGITTTNVMGCFVTFTTHVDPLATLALSFSAREKKSVAGCTVSTRIAVVLRTNQH